MNIKTERLVIRDVLMSDLEVVHELHSLPETDKYNTLGIPETIEITKDIINEWLSENSETHKKKYVFSVENIENDFIGIIGVNIGKPKHKNAEIWFKLHSKYWNKGFATEMTSAVLKFCFLELGLHRIEAGCAVENIASKNVLEKVGMIQEGLSRKILPIRGEWVDGFRFSILETEFESNNR